MPAPTSRSRLALALTALALAASTLTGCGMSAQAQAAEACEVWQDEVWSAAHVEGGFDVASAAHIAKLAERPAGCGDDWHLDAAKTELCESWTDMAWDATHDIERSVPADQVEATNATIAAALEPLRAKRPAGCDDNWKTDAAAEQAYAEKQYPPAEPAEPAPGADVTVPDADDGDSPINAGCGWSWRGGFGCGVGVG
ncbi:hypothetical protein [Cellulosimicrobium sp. Marseille-Q8652]